MSVHVSTELPLCPIWCVRGQMVYSLPGPGCTAAASNPVVPQSAQHSPVNHVEALYCFYSYFDGIQLLLVACQQMLFTQSAEFPRQHLPRAAVNTVTAELHPTVAGYLQLIRPM
jgi:hypothetical protein